MIKGQILLLNIINILLKKYLLIGNVTISFVIPYVLGL